MSGKLKQPLLPVSLQQPTLSDMTMYEMNFSLLVEDTLKNIVLPEYRQIIVEASGRETTCSVFYRVSDFLSSRRLCSS